MNRRCARGFTLIEVMIVVVIVAILAAVAVPSYQSQIQKTRRADAKEALTRAAAAQERWFFSHNSYTDDLAQLGFAKNADGDFVSTDGHYTLQIPDDSFSNTEFVIRAEPVGGGSQAKDSACTQFEINQAGLKTANKVGGDNTAECWR